MFTIREESLKLSSLNSRRIRPEELDWRILLATHLLTKSLISRIDLKGLLDQLFNVVTAGNLSIPQSGVALYGAAYVHRVRTEMIFSEPSERPEQTRPELYLPPPIDIPLKPGFLAATMIEIVNALRSAMYREQAGPLVSSALQSDLSLDQYLVRIEEELEEFISLIKTLFGALDSWPLEEVLRKVSRLEAARRFILLLLAAGKGVVEIYQDESSGQILVRWPGRDAAQE